MIKTGTAPKYRCPATALALIATALSQTSLGSEFSASRDTGSRDVIDAIWRVQHVDFNHRSARGLYACDALQASLEHMLMTLGAHESLSVRMQCTRTIGVNAVRARITIAIPVEATEENVRAATRFDMRARLAARLGGFSLPTAADIERFPAAWRRIALARDGRFRFAESDCELLSDVQTQILPRLSVRSLRRLHCVPWATRITQTLEVEALVPISGQP